MEAYELPFFDAEEEADLRAEVAHAGTLTGSLLSAKIKGDWYPDESAQTVAPDLLVVPSYSVPPAGTLMGASHIPRAAARSGVDLLA